LHRQPFYNYVSYSKLSSEEMYNLSSSVSCSDHKEGLESQETERGAAEMKKKIKQVLIALADVVTRFCPLVTVHSHHFLFAHTFISSF